SAVPSGGGGELPHGAIDSSESGGAGTVPVPTQSMIGSSAPMVSNNPGLGAPAASSATPALGVGTSSTQPAATAGASLTQPASTASTLPVTPPSSPDVQFAMQVDVSPGAELISCEYFKFPTDLGTIAVPSAESEFTPGSHHLLAYRTDLTDIPADHTGIW